MFVFYFSLCVYIIINFEVLNNLSRTMDSELVFAEVQQVIGKTGKYKGLRTENKANCYWLWEMLAVEVDK